MSEAAWAARAWMLDLDLTPLGERPEAFNANTEALRREYAHLSDQAWNQGRAAFLRGIAATPRLFRTPVLHTAFEPQARANFARDLARAPSHKNPRPLCFFSQNTPCIHRQSNLNN